ncbi:MAG TPA: hypothetical protein VHP80_19100, partial [Candidatus Acidoferrum sp.]|nr:hypothetical protein [Candidatus Acidoferrum sp.]
YKREELAPQEPLSTTPMNRLVDAVNLESDKARQFGELVDAFVASNCQQDLEIRLRAQLLIWRDNDAKLQPLEQRSFLVKEVSQASQDLSTLGTIGLEALDLMLARKAGPADWKTSQSAVITKILVPKAQLLIMPAGAIQKLVDAASAGGACAK